MKKLLLASMILSLSVVNAADINSESECRNAAITALINTTVKVHSLSAAQEQSLIFSGMGGETKELYQAIKTYCKFLNTAAVEIQK